MSVVAIGDIHGDLGALESLLTKLSPSLESSDTVVFVGDYIDGGPDSKGCIDRVLRFREETTAAVVALMGNHEEWFLRSVNDPTKHSWILSMEGLSTIHSYSDDVAALLRHELKRKATELILDPTPLPYSQFVDILPPEHMEFLRGLELYFRDDQCVVVHAGVSDQYVAVESETERVLRWGCPSFPDAYSGDDTIIYGHTPTPITGGRPTVRIEGKTIGIDTIHSGILTAIRYPEMEIIQSGQSV